MFVDMLDAVLEPDAQADCSAGYRAALDRHGLGDIRSTTPAREAPGQRWVFLVRPAPGADAIGGLWLDRLDPGFAFSHGPELGRLDARLGAGGPSWPAGTGELAAGWVDEAWTGLGLFGLLLLAAVCGAPRVGIRHIAALAGAQSFGALRRAGFRTVEGVGEAGWFDYPAGYRSVLCQRPTTEATGMRPGWHDAHRAGLAGARELVAPNARPGGPAGRIRLPPAMAPAAREVGRSMSRVG